MVEYYKGILEEYIVLCGTKPHNLQIKPVCLLNIYALLRSHRQNTLVLNIDKHTIREPPKNTP